jgi:hypothetical protein
MLYLVVLFFKEFVGCYIVTIFLCVHFNHLNNLLSELLST